MFYTDFTTTKREFTVKGVREMYGLRDECYRVKRTGTSKQRGWRG